MPYRGQVKVARISGLLRNQGRANVSYRCAFLRTASKTGHYGRRPNLFSKGDQLILMS